jgi:biopolymer transport protein ExbD
MAKLKKKPLPDVGVPSCSLADMAFLLLIFFIVSTTFVKEKGLRVELPRAESIDKIQRANAVTVYVDRSSTISIDDFEVDIPMIEGVMFRKLLENHSMITCFRTDTDTNYGVMADIMNQLRRANALRVSFEAKHKVR